MSRFPVSFLLVVLCCLVVLNNAQIAAPLSSCRRSSYYQKTSELTSFSRCIPALVDIGTCYGECKDTDVCNVCDVEAYGTRRIRCRTLENSIHYAWVDTVKSCSCQPLEITYIPTSEPTPEPTPKPTDCEDPPVSQICLRYVGSTGNIDGGFSCNTMTDAQVDAKLNLACSNAFAGSWAIKGSDIMAHNAAMGTIQCLPTFAPWILVPACPYCGARCDCGGARKCAISGNITSLPWSSFNTWTSGHGSAVLRASCVIQCNRELC